MKLNFFAALLFGATALGAAFTASALAQSDELPDGQGKAELREFCTNCHTTAVIAAKRRSPEEWSDVITRMVGMGAQATEEQQVAILGYLQANLGSADNQGSPEPTR